ncbi:MAG: hypothetical protein SOW45_02600 [Prevotella sp.]|nr:hypothetical protein [Prevotella sp.]
MNRTSAKVQSEHLLIILLTFSPQNGPSQRSIWRKTIGMEDANKGSTTLKNRVFAAMSMIFSMNTHHFGGQVVVYCSIKACEFHA